MLLRAIALSIGLLPGMAGAECRLALALALDVSRSVDATDFRIQTDGLIAALEDPVIRTTIFVPAGDVALAIYQWSGDTYQETVVGWTMIRQPADLAPVLAALRALRPPKVRLHTALGQALVFGRALMAEAPACRRRVLDVSGDGRNNNGPTPNRIYAEGGWDGITVNGLAIGAHEMGIEAYYNEVLIHGPGAFVELALRHTDFPEAMRRKLQRELTEAFSAADPALRRDSRPQDRGIPVDSGPFARKS